MSENPDNLETTASNGTDNQTETQTETEIITATGPNRSAVESDVSKRVGRQTDRTIRTDEVVTFREDDRVIGVAPPEGVDPDDLELAGDQVTVTGESRRRLQREQAAQELDADPSQIEIEGDSARLSEEARRQRQRESAAEQLDTAPENVVLEDGQATLAGRATRAPTGERCGAVGYGARERRSRRRPGDAC